jgi:predicted MFS family arabinose efflux permease
VRSATAAVLISRLFTPSPLVARAESRYMTRKLTLLFAATTGVAVANLYYVQPLLALIGRDLHTHSSATGLLVTAT